MDKHTTLLPQESGEQVKEPIQEKVKEQVSKETLKTISIIMVVAFMVSMVVPYLWFFAAGASIIFPVLFLLWGAVTFNKGGSRLMGFAILFFIAAVVVGYGTCLVNMGALH